MLALLAEARFAPGYFDGTLESVVRISSEREHAQHLQESTENVAKSCRFDFQTDEKRCESRLLSMPRSTPWEIGQARADVQSTRRWDQVNREGLNDGNARERGSRPVMVALNFRYVKSARDPITISGKRQVEL
jgi:hypothetical protein